MKHVAAISIIRPKPAMSLLEKQAMLDVVEQVYFQLTAFVAFVDTLKPVE